MAITVPKYNRQVEVDTPRYQDAPSIPKTDLSPNMRSLNVIGQANQNLADTGVKIAGLISKHMQERVKQKQEAEVASREFSYRTEMQQLLYSKERIKIKNQDGEYETTAGLLNRPLDQASGIGMELREKQQALKDKYLKGLTTREQYDALNKSMDGTFTSAYGMTLNYEADQSRKADISKHTLKAEQQILSGALIGDPKLLNNAIDNLNSTVDKIGAIEGLDEESLDYARKKKASILAANSAESFLANTGSLDGAIGLLDSVKKRILPYQYEDIKKKLNANKKSIDNLAKENLNMQKDELYSKLFDGSLTLREVEAVNKPIEQGGIGGKAAVDLKNKVIKAQNVILKDITTDSTSAEKYINLVDKIISDQSTAYDLKEMMVDYYSDGVLSSEETKQINGVKKILNDMKWNKESGWFKNVVEGVKFWGGKNASNEVLAGALRKIVTNGATFKDAESADAFKNEIIKESQIKLHPQRATYNIGDKIQRGGNTFEVTGYDDSGKVLFKRVK